MTKPSSPPPMTDEQAREIGASIVADLHERFRVDPDGLHIHSPELVEQHLASLEGAKALTSGRFASRKVPMHPQVADAIRDANGWDDAFVSLMRYAGNPEQTITTVKDRRWRLRRFLNALNHGMGLHPDLAELGIRDDLALLGLALDGLDVGVVRPLLRKPQGVGNRPPDTRAMQQFRVYVVTFAIIREQAGSKRMDAFKWVAKELTAAGATALKADATKNPGFSAETVKKYFYDAMPGREEARQATEAANAAKEGAVSKKLNGDTALVARLIGQFVIHAQEDEEQLPPRLVYAEEVIRRTMADPAFQDLIP